jgi:hypothetical protein
MDVRVSRDELIAINNALNEVCNGIQIEDFEFQTRLGSDRSVLRDLLDEVAGIIDSSGEN